MKTIISNKLQRILKNKKRLEKSLNIEITSRGKEVYIHGKPEDEFIAEKVIDAINLGFPLSVALSIHENNFELEVLNIKDYTRRKNLESVRSRMIGKSGKTLKTLTNLTGCRFEIKGNSIGVIGPPELLKNAEEAISSIARGAKQGNVYAHLEKTQPKPVYDLGLKHQ